MRSLVIALQSEFYKSRKTLAFWAAIILPVIICTSIAFGFFSNPERIIKMHYTPEMLWMAFSTGALSVMGMLILPFYVIFMAFSVNNIEHKNDTWKTLFAQPLNKLSIYAAKYLYAVILVFICLFLFVLLTYLFGNLLHLLISGFKFNAYSPIKLLSGIYFKLFLSSLGMLSIQFIISLIWADFLKPMGIGFIGLIMGIIVATKGWKYAYFIPYSHPSLALSSGKASPHELFTQEIYSSLIYALVFFIIGYFIVARKSIK